MTRRHRLYLCLRLCAVAVLLKASHVLLAMAQRLMPDQ